MSADASTPTPELDEILRRYEGQWVGGEVDHYAGRYVDFVYERTGFYIRTRYFNSYGELEQVTVEYSKYINLRGLRC